MSQDPDRQIAGTQIRIALKDRFLPHGTAEIVLVTGPHRGRGNCA